MSNLTETLMAEREAGMPGGDRPAFAGRPGAALAAALLGFFVVTLDAVVVNVALPSVRSDLGGGIAGLQWVVGGYTLAFAVLLLPAGVLADRIGAGRALGLGVFGFVGASLACGLAPWLGVLLVSRVVQGGAAAVIMPASLTLVGLAYPDRRRRAHAVAAWAMGGAIASSSGPVLGGLLTLASWRWIFLVNLPVGLVALVLLRRTRTAPVPLTVSVSGRVAAALGLVRNRTVVSVLLVGFAFMVGYYGLPFVMSLFLQQERGLSSLQTGEVFLPMMLIGLCLTPVVPHLTHRVSARTMIVGGLLCMTAGLAAVALVPGDFPLAGYAALMVLVGLGGPTVAPPISSVLLDVVPAATAGTASGLLNTSRQLGGAVSVAVLGALLANSSGMASGMRAGLLVAAVAVAAAAAAAAYGLGTTHPHENHEAKENRHA